MSTQPSAETGERIYVAIDGGHHDRALVHSVEGDGTLTAHICATGERVSGLKHRSRLCGAHCDESYWIKADE